MPTVANVSDLGWVLQLAQAGDIITVTLPQGVRDLGDIAWLPEDPQPPRETLWDIIPLL